MYKSFFGAFIGLITLFTCSSCTPGQSTASYNALAQCLTDKGVAMYGSYTCSHCLNQKKAFGNSFKYATYYECHPNGPDPQPEKCQEAGITGYPTWTFPGQDPSIGEQKLETLAEKANCQAALTQTLEEYNQSKDAITPEDNS